MSVPDLLHSIPPPFSERLMRQTDALRSRIVKTNYYTQFAQNAPELNDFRHVTTGLVNGTDDDVISKPFLETVCFTTYDSYAPFVARFFQKPCKASAIVDLLAPGLPDFLAGSSSTSGGLPKMFPKYNCMSKIRSKDAGGWAVSDPLQGRTRAYIFWLGLNQLSVEDQDNCPTTIYDSFNSAITERMNLYLDPEKDEEKMGTFVLDHATPYAAAFIEKWRSFLLIHALFAIGSRSLGTMNMVFITTFVEMIRYLDMEFDMLVDCIAEGTIPDLDGITKVRDHLESNIFPDPERAMELRCLGRPSSQSGWCSRVWPNLRSISCIASGSFSSSVPLAQWFLGPDIDIRARGYGSTEARIGLTYNPLELNQFKLNREDIIEFLDVSKDDSITALAQLWEVELGKRYEVVVTTRNGLWRYRLEDVVEICGFDPTDGVPVVQFVERRNMAIRFTDFMVSEKELRATMASAAPTIPSNIVNWTTTMDDRRDPPTIGFFVELAGCKVSASDLVLVPECMLDGLLRSNKSIDLGVTNEVFRKPTVRLVRPGTFSDFLQLKLDQGSRNFGQVKVPVVLPKAEYVTWFLNRVVEEL